MTWHADTAIVGGGPAGAIIARRLALMGWKVMLLERGERLRPKACGHCLAPRAWRLLAHEGLGERVRGVANGTTDRLHVHPDRDVCVRTRLAPADTAGGLMVPRDRFDQMLRDAAAEAGASVHHSASVRVQQIDGTGATLSVSMAKARVQLRCSLLIGADGLGSAIARAAGLANATAAGRKYGFALTVPGAMDSGAIESGAIEMFLLRGGYLGAIRQHDGVIHLAALVASRGRRLRSNPTSVLAQAAGAHPRLEHILKTATSSQLNRDVLAVGPMPWRPRAVAARRVALVGDAAGYIEPFTGEGMAWAIESALLLSACIAESGNAWNHATADMYARMWRERIERRQRLCRWLAAGLQRPLVSGALARAAIALPSLTGRLVRQAVAA